MRLAMIGTALALAACPATPAPRLVPQAPKSPVDPIAHAMKLQPGVQKPKLVVLFVIDQLPAWSFEQKRAAFTGGFARLLREGEWHTGEHPSAATLTGPGHALLGTGEATWHSGILGNEWWDRPAAKIVHAAEDVDGTISARWLRVPGLGDSIAAASSGAKAVSVALKDRASVLPLGHAGTALYYDAETATWHATQGATWLAAYDRAHPVAARLKETWTPLDPARLAKLSNTVDDAPGEVGEKGFGKTFPHVHATTKKPADSIYATPLGNELTFDLALAAIQNEGLGDDDVTDLLVVSLSAHDYVGHGWGHESWEAWDMMLRIDQQLGKFLGALDAKVGADRWSLVFTSDHGASPQPRTHGGGAMTYDSIKDAANRAAVTQLGAGDWISYVKYPTVFLSAAARARPPKERARTLLKIVYALRSFPGLDTVELTPDIAGDCTKKHGKAARYCMAVDPERSGEVFFHPRPHWIFEDQAGRFATAHGSLHPFDREVPLVLLPPGRVAHEAAAQPSGTLIPEERVAEVLAGYLGVTPPRKLPR